MPDRHRLYSCDKKGLLTLECMAALERRWQRRGELNTTVAHGMPSYFLLLLCYVACTLIFNTNSPINRRNNLLNICNVLIALTFDKLLSIFVKSKRRQTFKLSTFLKIIISVSPMTCNCSPQMFEAIIQGISVANFKYSKSNRIWDFSQYWVLYWNSPIYRLEMWLNQLHNSYSICKEL